MWHKTFLLCNVQSQKIIGKHILSCKDFAPFSRHLRQGTHAHASFKCSFVAMALLASHRNTAIRPLEKQRKEPHERLRIWYGVSDIAKIN